MCNEFRYTQSADKLHGAFRQLNVPLTWAAGQASNLEPRDSIRIRDSAAVIGRTSSGVELSMMPWAWPGPGGKPVFNFRSDGRSFAKSDRRLIPADGFYEFTAPKDPKQKRKDRWLFTLAGEPWFWIAAIVRDGCFAMLTTAPGPDIAPYHDRQVAVLPRREGLAWLELTKPEGELLRPLPAGSLEVAAVRAEP
jgi:putative SOS response-associated peptidase YedK